MITVSYENQLENRKFILGKLLYEKSKNKDFRIIDIGGSANNWTSEIADSTVDLFATQEQDFKFNITNDWEWNDLLDHVETVGKFDFAICTHTLEDISHPATVLRNLPKVAKKGVITTPTIELELSRIENHQWLGFIHHKYLFDFVEDSIVFAPKISFLETALSKGLTCPSGYPEIVFNWENDIPYRIFMDDYLGPDAQTVIDEYEKFIKSAIEKSKNSRKI